MELNTCWKSHKHRNRNKNRIKREWASLVGLCQKHKPQHPHDVKVSPWGSYGRQEQPFCNSKQTHPAKSQWREMSVSFCVYKHEITHGVCFFQGLHRPTLSARSLEALPMIIMSFEWNDVRRTNTGYFAIDDRKEISVDLICLKVTTGVSDLFTSPLWLSLVVNWAQNTN